MNRNFACLIPATALAMILSVPAFAQPAAPCACRCRSSRSQPRSASSTSRPPLWAPTRGSATSRTLQKKFDPKRQELEGLNKEVDELQKKFNAQGDKLNDEARGELLKEIDTKKKQLQRNYEDANTDIQAQQNDIANRIGQKLVSVLDKYAKDNDFTVILDVSGQQSPVLWAASSVDITQAVVEAYNTESGVPAPPKKAAAADAKPAADAKK